MVSPKGDHGLRHRLPWKLGVWQVRRRTGDG